MSNNILVIGGTGNIGTPLVGLLKDSAENYKVLARSDESAASLAAQNVPTIRGALGEWSGIETALGGIDTVSLLSSPSPDMPNLHKGLIDRAVSAGVRKIVRLSAEPANDAEGLPMYEDHADADAYLQASGLEYVILRPHYFMQNIVEMHAGYMKNNGMFAQYLGNARIPMVDTRDVARAAFIALTSNEFNGEIYEITGPRAISYYDVAKAFSNALGKDIQYVSMSYEEQKAGLEALGLPDMITTTVMTLFKRWADAGERPATQVFEEMTGQIATDIDVFATDAAQQF
ncbi:NmrA family NAD(P)-binding protein [Ruegeria sp. SCP11]|uniref:NmrA family NAD(P)-binding protein n=1 Tax=Ruegeria sp. SCP11 TaxID=3141378 RepID=UPI00333AB902